MTTMYKILAPIIVVGFILFVDDLVWFLHFSL
jgi:hypothetical protein